MNKYKIWPGDPYPLGSHWDGQGANFALFAENADKVELCLFDERGEKETQRILMPEHNNLIWHVYLPGIKPGQLYGYRVYGQYAPQKGLRFNPTKLLIDPYAKAVAGVLEWDDALFGYNIGHKDSDLSRDTRNSVQFVPKSVVIDPSYDWEGDKPLHIPFHKTIIYETHVKGLTQRHPEVPPELRGTYAAMTCPAILNYFKKLGITAVELMPIHQFITDRHLEEKGLSNYWGYNSIAFFAPHAPYSSSGTHGQQVKEFKDMVKALHREGIEVILDVVYNHTGEGNQLGPTISFRGIDNRAYYRLAPGNPRFYMDYTGTGNTLNMMQPNVLQLIMDSLRYWILDMHIDGFRFDLAAALARELHEVDRLSAFFDIIRQDPVISQTKLIAEPWDVGEGGYQVGQFPPGWTEWNGKYRDTVRDYWRGADSTLAEFANRFTGSSDLYETSGRKPTASINFVTAHDGFTLRDLVSYNHKHNEANLESNQDGENHNRAWNCGHEGETNAEEVIKCRHRQQRNFLATLLLSQGVPMLLGGDEIGRTQGGNNNAYNQDNQISWYDWEHLDGELLAFTQALIAMRHQHPVFRQRKWFSDEPDCPMENSAILWFTPDGERMKAEYWEEGFAKQLGIFLNGRKIRSLGREGEQIVDDCFFLIFNAYQEPVEFRLPGSDLFNRWKKVLDTQEDIPAESDEILKSGEIVPTEGISMIVLRHVD